jgi:HKD family nuclease
MKIKTYIVHIDEDIAYAKYNNEDLLRLDKNLLPNDIEVGDFIEINITKFTPDGLNILLDNIKNDMYKEDEV